LQGGAVTHPPLDHTSIQALKIDTLLDKATPRLSSTPGIKKFPPQMPSKRRGTQPTPRNTYPGCSTIRYNRKSNPDLEKRRTHRCDAPSEYLLIPTLQMEVGTTKNTYKMNKQ